MKRYFILYSSNILQIDKKKQYIIGRSGECDIKFSHQSVSRKHGIIQWQKNGFIIKDLQSTNGIFLNTHKIDQKVLADNDKIRIGVYYLEYRETDTETDQQEMPSASDTIVIENRIDEIVNAIDNPELSNKILGLKHHINKKSEKLSHLAYIDELTGLQNRRYFDEKLEEELVRAKRYKRELTILMADIDHFKQFNDTYGHQKGDEVLQTVSEIIRSVLRKTDIPARYGGEEICIILPETKLRNGYKLAQKIKTRIRKQSITRARVEVTISIGVASLNRRCNTPEKIVEAADRALYRAKENGRNRCEMER